MTTDLPAPDAASGSHRPPLNYYGELARRQWEGQAKDHLRHVAQFSYAPLSGERLEVYL
jgi:hypothetical protein